MNAPHPRRVSVFVRWNSPTAARNTRKHRIALGRTPAAARGHLGCSIMRSGRNRSAWRVAGMISMTVAAASLAMGGCSEETQRIFRENAASGLESSAQSLANAVITGAFAAFQGAASSSSDSSSGSTSNDNTNSSQTP